MKLVLAEKPSVAQSLAKVLGVTNRQDGYLEGNGYIVSWCVGHLVELAQPEAYDERYGKWTYGDLPILPDDWKYEVSAGTRKQFGILKKLMARDDVVSLVCATDAGREGELIFRLVYHQCHCKKPFERLWISSMEDSAIMEGFEILKPGTEYDALYEAALCRERADWIVGINASIESIGTAVVVYCNDCLYPRKFDHQHFLLCDRSVAPGDCRLLHLLHCKGTVDFPGYPCRYGINGDPYNLPVGMGSCKT